MLVVVVKTFALPMFFALKVNEPNQIIRIKGNVLPAPEDGTPVNNAGPAN
jgi:hypothetical protein